MKVICALLCLAVVAHAANIQRVSRNTEAIIPSIVEEILKVELKSDLKKNSAVEVEETEPIVKEDVVVEPIASRTVVEEVKTVGEEKTPVIVETIVETIPSVRTLVDEKVPEIIEKVEIIAIEQVPEKTVDNFRTESVPETPVIAEIIKETVVVEPIPEVRSSPVATEAVTEEEEVIKPMVRNVIKEEIPQIEELRVIPETDAVKDTIPEPVVSANIVEPVVEVEPQVKTLTIEMEKMMIPEMMAEEMNMKTVPEMIMMMKEDLTKMKASLVPEMMEEKKEEPEMVKDEVKAIVTEEEVKKEEVEGIFEPATKGVDGRQSIIQQLGQTAVNTLANVPVIGTIVQRITPTTEAAAVADAVPADVVEGSEAPLEGEAPVAAGTTHAPPPPNPVQQLIQNVQTGFQNQVQSVQTFLTGGASSNTATVSDTADDTARPNIIQQIQQGLTNGVQGFVAGVQSNLANFGINLPQSNSPTKTDDKPEDTSAAEPVAEEAAAAKSVEPLPQAVIEPEPVVVKKEETPVEKIEIVETQS